MARSVSKSKLSKIDQALSDLFEAYLELDSDLEEAHEDDEDAYNHAMMEALEASVENALEEHDVSPANAAAALSFLCEALEQIDPNAFDSESEEDDDEEDDDKGEYEDIDLEEGDEDYEDDEEDD